MVERLLSERDVRHYLGGMLSQLARKYHVPGAQLAVHHDGETVTFEAGESEYGTGHQILRDSAFPVGSISKCFTAAVAMVLVADGDIELDAPLGKHLPELDSLGTLLTLRQALSHTGGLTSGPDPEVVSTASLRRYVVDHCRADTLVFPPGTGFSYSNIGYVLAGLLIETITGMTWYEAVESLLLRPLGITPAFIGAPGLQPSGRPYAVGHSVNPAVGRTRPVPQSIAPAEAPAGGLMASAADLVEFGLLHVGPGVPGLLEGTYTELMRQAVPAADPFGLADGWGLGLAVFRGGNGAGNWVGHDGNAHGTSCHLRIDPSTGWVIAFTSNANSGSDMWRELLVKLTTETSIPAPSPGSWAFQERPITPPSGCRGTFVNGDVEYVVAAEEDGTLSLAVDGDSRVRLACYEDLVFSLWNPTSGRQELGGRFLQDQTTGKVNGIQVSGRLACRRIPTACQVGGN